MNREQTDPRATAQQSDIDADLCPVCDDPYTDELLFLKGEFDGVVCVESGPVRRYGGSEIPIPKAYLHDASVEKHE